MSAAASLWSAGAAAAGVQSITTAASLGCPSSGAAQLLRCGGTPSGLRNGVVCASIGRRSTAERKSSGAPPPSVLHKDDVQGGPPGEEELSMLSSAVEEVIAGLEKEVGGSMIAGVETKVQRKMARRKKEQKTYLLAAIASTTGFTSMSAAAVVYRFWVQMPDSGAIPYPEVFATFSLAVGAAVAMEYWARWAHKALWHASLWHMHESHHKPRDGPFETNDVFAIINAVPAISLMLYGFLSPGLVPAVCFGAGLGITMFGIAYMFVHDGLVHKRFPVGPIAEVPYFQKVAAAHQLHHADLYEGVPYGLFLGPKELEKVGGGGELEKLVKQRAKAAAVAELGRRNDSN